jgi:hypothetical protein
MGAAGRWTLTGLRGAVRHQKPAWPRWVRPAGRIPAGVDGEYNDSCLYREGSADELPPYSPIATRLQRQHGHAGTIETADHLSSISPQEQEVDRLPPNLRSRPATPVYVARGERDTSVGNCVDQPLAPSSVGVEHQLHVSEGGVGTTPARRIASAACHEQITEQ